MSVERINFFGKCLKDFSGKIILGTKWLRKIDWDFSSKERGITTTVRKSGRPNLSMPLTSGSRRSETLLSLLNSAN